MSACPRPQSSVQMTGNVPVLDGVTTIVLIWPGRASCFCDSSGDQNEWMTSSAVIWSFTWRPFGRVRKPYVFPFGYVNFHANWTAVTFTTSGFEPALLFWASTIALTIEIAVTRTAGIAV